MPNWCSNQLRIKCKDPANLKTLVDAWESGHFMQSLYPCPQDLKDTMAGSYGDDEKQKELEIKEKANIAKYGYPNWYDWCVANWGTKWDIDTDSGEYYVTGDTFHANFDTAWSPPIEFLMYLDGNQTDAYDIECEYEEEGIGYHGIYTTEYGEETKVGSRDE